MPQLTDFSLKNLAPPVSGRITLWDENSPLGVRVTANGAKTFIVMLGPGRRHTIGRYPQITLQHARSAAKHLKAEKTLGRLLPRSVALTVAKQQYLDQADIRPATRGYYVRNLDRLTASKVADVTPTDITDVLDKLPASSRLQCLRTYTAFFNWCARRHYIDRSPCERMEGGKTKRRERVLDRDELRLLWAATAGSDPYHSLVRLLLVTGQRKTEWAHSRDKWLDDYGVRFPADVCKNNNDHHFPLGSLARSLLPVRKGLLFPSDADTPYSAWSKSKIELDKKLDIEPYQLRDLRRTYRTIHASIGTSRDLAERLINHISEQGELEKVYDRFDYAEPMQNAQYHYEEHLSKMIGIG